MTSPPEVNTLEASLQALKHPPDPTHLPTLSRAVIRAADDLELVAEETADRSVRKSLHIQIAQARKAVAAARKHARRAALTIDRTQLLEDSQQPDTRETDTDAARLARQINDSLRRTTAIVTEEVDRSNAAGNIIDQSTRRLRMTRDQQGRYGESLLSGADTLKSIRRTEILANVLIIASFTIFFLAALYVTRQRIANSNLSTFVLRPGFNAASIPIRIVGWAIRAIGGRPRKGRTAEVLEKKISSPAQQADEAVKAKEGREELETGREEDKNNEDIGVVNTDTEASGENGTCAIEQDCVPPDMADTKERNEPSPDATANSVDHGADDSVKPASDEDEDHSDETMSDGEVDKPLIENSNVNNEPDGAHDVGVHEEASPSAQPNDAGELQHENEQSKYQADGKHTGRNEETMERAAEDGERYDGNQGDDRGTEFPP